MKGISQERDELVNKIESFDNQLKAAAEEKAVIDRELSDTKEEFQSVKNQLLELKENLQIELKEKEVSVVNTSEVDTLFDVSFMFRMRRVMSRHRLIIMSGLITSCHPCLVMFSCITSCHVTSRHSMPCHVTSHHAMSCHHVISRHAMSPQVTLRLCYITSCHIMPCFVTSCFIRIMYLGILKKNHDS